MACASAPASLPDAALELWPRLPSVMDRDAEVNVEIHTALSSRRLLVMVFGHSTRNPKTWCELCLLLHTGRQLSTCTRHKSVFALLVFICNYIKIIMIWFIISGFSFFWFTYTYFFYANVIYLTIFLQEVLMEGTIRFPTLTFHKRVSLNTYINSAIGLQSAQRQLLVFSQVCL